MATIRLKIAAEGEDSRSFAPLRMTILDWVIFKLKIFRR
jgi:hypothetical protein